MKEKTIECPQCTGTGNLEKVTVRDKDGRIIYEHEVICPNCGGSGVILIAVEK